MAIVEVSDLCKAYGGVDVLTGVTFAVEEGEIFGILGHNGSGKTTTIESLAGLRVPDGGRIRVLGVDPRTDRDTIRAGVGVQLQQARLPDKIRVDEALRLFASFYPAPRDVDGLVDLLGLGGHRATHFRRLSGGLQQRVSLALALIGSPRVAVLDELTTGLDPHARREVWQLIEDVRAGGVTILLVTHSMEEAERLCDRAAILHDGRVAACDTPDGLVHGAGGGVRVTFRPSGPLTGDLDDLAGVADVRRDGDRLVVQGRAGVLDEVLAHLTAHGVTPLGLRVDEPSLDDAFIAITGRADTVEDAGAAGADAGPRRKETA